MWRWVGSELISGVAGNVEVGGVRLDFRGVFALCRWWAWLWLSLQWRRVMLRWIGFCGGHVCPVQCGRNAHGSAFSGAQQCGGELDQSRACVPCAAQPRLAMQRGWSYEGEVGHSGGCLLGASSGTAVAAS